MIFNVCVFLGFLLVLYFGKIIGLCVYCENKKEYYPFKRYLYMIPIFEIGLWFVGIIEMLQIRSTKNMKEFWKRRNIICPLILFFIYDDESIRKDIIEMDQMIRAPFYNDKKINKWRSIFSAVVESIDASFSPNRVVLVNTDIL